MKINKHHTYNRAACICIAACLLFLSALTACSSEAEPEVMNEEWIPLEINIGSIEKLEVSPMSKAETTELPDIVRMKFRENDELKLQYDGKTTYVVLQADGSWKTRNGTSLMLRPNTTYTIDAEYGEPLGYDDYSTTDYLRASAEPAYDASSKTYTCSFNFTRPEEYSCLKVEFKILDPGDPIQTVEGVDEYVTFINARFNLSPNDVDLSPIRFPITNNRIEVLYCGDIFTAYGVYLQRSHDLDPVLFRRFDSALPDYELYSFTVTPGYFTNVLMIYPYPVWEIP